MQANNWSAFVVAYSDAWPGRNRVGVQGFQKADDRETLIEQPLSLREQS